jgi:hypothetical protein
LASADLLFFLDHHNSFVRSIHFDASIALSATGMRLRHPSRNSPQETYGSGAAIPLHGDKGHESNSESTNGLTTSVDDLDPKEGRVCGCVVHIAETDEQKC